MNFNACDDAWTEGKHQTRLGLGERLELRDPAGNTRNACDYADALGGKAEVWGRTTAPEYWSICH